MTNEQAIEILEHNWTKLVNPDCTDEELGQALDLAITALKGAEQCHLTRLSHTARKTGDISSEWLK